MCARLFSNAARPLPQTGQTKPSGQRRSNKNAAQLVSSGKLAWNSLRDRALATAAPSRLPGCGRPRGHYTTYGATWDNGTSLEITKEKERVSEALARVDAQREKLAVQLLELEATERVLARYSKGSGARRMASATPITATNVGAPGRAGGPRRSTTTKPAGGERSSPPHTVQFRDYFPDAPATTAGRVLLWANF